MKNLYFRSRQYSFTDKQFLYKTTETPSYPVTEKKSEAKKSKELLNGFRDKRIELVESVRASQEKYNETVDRYQETRNKLMKIDPNRFDKQFYDYKKLGDDALVYYEDEKHMNLPIYTPKKGKEYMEAKYHEGDSYDRKVQVMNEQMIFMDKLIKSHEKVNAWQTQCPQADITIEIHNWEYKITKVGNRDALTDFIRNGKATWLERHVLPPGFQTLQENH